MKKLPSIASLATFLCILCIGLPVAKADTIRLTIYDDGLSCPANCDAHVVFHQSMNGTQFAHLPQTPASPFSKCISGQMCRLCIESGGKQCLEAMYRGGGPSLKTFDFTPRFYELACAASPGQPALISKCNELKKAAGSLKNRKNCIAQPDVDGCRELIERATSVQKVDRPAYEQCRTMGEASYNKTKPVAQKRSNNCAYEFKGTGGPNSKGTTWKRLLPGACHDGTFVGRDGLDCCSGVLFADGPLSLECKHFYPK